MNRLITYFLLLLLVIALVGCSNNLIMSEKDYKNAHNNFANSIILNNQFVLFMNQMPKNIKDGPDEETWFKNLEVLEESIDLAKDVKPEYMNSVHPEFESNWEQFYIPSMQGIYNYYYKAIRNPDSIAKLNASGGPMPAYQLNEFWGNWFDNHKDEIIRNHNNNVTYCFESKPNKDQCNLHKAYKNK